MPSVLVILYRCNWTLCVVSVLRLHFHPSRTQGQITNEAQWFKIVKLAEHDKSCQSCSCNIQPNGFEGVSEKHFHVEAKNSFKNDKLQKHASKPQKLGFRRDMGWPVPFTPQDAINVNQPQWLEQTFVSNSKGWLKPRSPAAQQQQGARRPKGEPMPTSSHPSQSRRETNTSWPATCSLMIIKAAAAATLKAPLAAGPTKLANGGGATPPLWPTASKVNGISQ